jgi:hypothetical protein
VKILAAAIPAYREARGLDPAASLPAAEGDGTGGAPTSNTPAV